MLYSGDIFFSFPVTYRKVCLHENYPIFIRISLLLLCVPRGLPVTRGWKIYSIPCYLQSRILALLLPLQLLLGWMDLRDIHCLLWMSKTVWFNSLFFSFYIPPPTRHLGLDKCSFIIFICTNFDFASKEYFHTLAPNFQNHHPFLLVNPILKKLSSNVLFWS